MWARGVGAAPVLRGGDAAGKPGARSIVSDIRRCRGAIAICGAGSALGAASPPPGLPPGARRWWVAAGRAGQVTRTLTRRWTPEDMVVAGSSWIMALYYCFYYPRESVLLQIGPYDRPPRSSGYIHDYPQR